MEFELPKINVSFEYDEEKDEIVFVINGVEKRVKTEDMITEMEKLQDQNTALEQQPCEDCISRAEAIEQYTRWYADFMSLYDNGNFQDVLKNLPSVQPKSKTGHWINGDVTRWKCSNCGYGVLDWNNTPYCPNCGAKMESGE